MFLLASSAASFVLIKQFHGYIFAMRPMITYEFMHYSITTNEIGCYKVRNLFKSEGGVLWWLSPLNEIINHCQDVFVVVGALGCKLTA